MFSFDMIHGNMLTHLIQLYLKTTQAQLEHKHNFLNS